MSTPCIYIYYIYIYLLYLYICIYINLYNYKYIQGVLTARIFYGQRLFVVYVYEWGFFYELLFVVYIQRIFMHVKALHFPFHIKTADGCDVIKERMGLFTSRGHTYSCDRMLKYRTYVWSKYYAYNILIVSYIVIIAIDIFFCLYLKSVFLKPRRIWD